MSIENIRIQNRRMQRQFKKRIASRALNVSLSCQRRDNLNVDVGYDMQHIIWMWIPKIVKTDGPEKVIGRPRRNDSARSKVT